MSKAVHFPEYDVSVNVEQAQYLKTLTGKVDFQDAVEHYIVTCLMFFLDPQEELDKMKPKINPLMVDDFLSENEDGNSKE